MPRAFLLIREAPHYRRWAFSQGLTARGYEVLYAPPANPHQDDVLVIWNRYGINEEYAKRFESVGAAVLVCENGYVGRDEEGRQYYAIARNQHNGAGVWASGGGERWASMNIELAPWRTNGEHILICPSRGIGPRGVAMPGNWADDVTRRIRAMTKRPIRIRPHPRDRQPAISLSEDLRNCWAVVIWNSAAGVHALISGIPVFCDAPHWVCKSAAIESIDEAAGRDRLPAMSSMAWAQWSVNEITSGEPFRYLLPGAAKG